MVFLPPFERSRKKRKKKQPVDLSLCVQALIDPIHCDN